MDPGEGERGRGVAGGRCSTPSAFTIGFARRFTCYKHTALLFAIPIRLIGSDGDAPSRPFRVRRQGPPGRQRGKGS